MMAATIFMSLLSLMTSYPPTSVAHSSVFQGSLDTNTMAKMEDVRRLKDLWQNLGKLKKENREAVPMDLPPNAVSHTWNDVRHWPNDLPHHTPNDLPHHTPNDLPHHTPNELPHHRPSLESRVGHFLRGFQGELRHRKHAMATAEWNFQTNLTAWNSKQLEKEQRVFTNWWRRKSHILRSVPSERLPQSLARQIRLALTVSLASYNDATMRAISRLQSDLISTYSTAKVCLGCHGAASADADADADDAGSGGDDGCNGAGDSGCGSSSDGGAGGGVGDIGSIRDGSGNRGRNRSCLTLESGLVDLMATSRDPEVLERAWRKWRDVTGPWMKGRYYDLVTLLNSMARENGYRDYSRFERQQAFFETPDLDALQARLWSDIAPLYRQLHAYVRRKLVGAYGKEVVGNDGTIPAHLLGNMWAQNWVGIYDLVSPYPEVEDVFGDLDAMLSLSSSSGDGGDADARSMFSLAEEFYTSLGLPPMTPTFWKESVFTKPADGHRSMDCNARSFDMFARQDFRIKSCLRPSFHHLMTAFHEMGHMMYCMAYALQPAVYRTGASLASHESIGDMVQLSLMTSLSAHTPSSAPSVFDAFDDLRDENEKEKEEEDQEEEEEGEAEKEETKEEEEKEGRKAHDTARDKDKENDYEYKSTINRLMVQALEKVAFLPFGYLVDRWRHEVLSGDVTPDMYNRQWWTLRLQYQGVRPPTPRSEADFDPGAKYHVITNSMYSGYFVAQFQQFQMFSALCRESLRHPNIHRTRCKEDDPQVHSRFPDEDTPLHQCDITGSQPVARKLRRFLSYGSSVPWQRQLKEMTGESTVTSDAILTYFRPLHQWLKRENAKAGERIGWREAIINWRD